jgi:hypothetical protein
MAATKQQGFTFRQVKVYLTAFDDIRYDALQTEVLAKLAAQYDWVDFAFDRQRESGRGYYISAGFQIFVCDTEGTDFLIIDGGFTDWTQQLLSNRKERLLISGMGSERFLFCFG